MSGGDWMRAGVLAAYLLIGVAAWVIARGMRRTAEANTRTQRRMAAFTERMERLRTEMLLSEGRLRGLLREARSLRELPEQDPEKKESAND